jgi:hypothetical protein
MRESDHGQSASSAITIGVAFGIMITVVLESAMGAGLEAFTFAGGVVGAFTYALYSGARLRDCFLAGAAALVAGLVVRLGGIIGSGFDQEAGWRSGAILGVMLLVSFARVLDWIHRNRAGAEGS